MKNKLFFKNLNRSLYWCFTILLLNSQVSWGQASLSSIGVPYSQNFDDLTTSTFNLTDNTTITGVYALRASGNATPNVFTADNGGSNSGRFNNYGTTGTTDRALGSASSSTPGTLQYGVRLKNNTGAAISSLTITYSGEQWRNGGNTASQPLTFDYLQAATVTSLVGTFTTVAALTFNTTINTSTPAALDGNNASNRAVLTSVVTVNIPIGEEIMLRWTDINDSGNDHGVAIDNLSVTPTAAVACTPQTITALSSPVTKSFGDSHSIATTASSGLVVTYSSSNNSVASVDETGNVFIIGIGGPITLTASQAGNGSTVCPATPVTQSLTVTKATPTITSPPSATSITYGQT